eukprot:c8723_g1_i2.p1 GENE.c8723_g1_i2~~c8723_g1_i2.p1  ORF type:complete len:462 (-),score=54.41 c8723_g1_i2:559-1893(-)
MTGAADRTGELKRTDECGAVSGVPHDEAVDLVTPTTNGNAASQAITPSDETSTVAEFRNSTAWAASTRLQFARTVRTWNIGFIQVVRCVLVAVFLSLFKHVNDHQNTFYYTLYTSTIIQLLIAAYFVLSALEDVCQRHYLGSYGVAKCMFLAAASFVESFVFSLAIIGCWARKATTLVFVVTVGSTVAQILIHLWAAAEAHFGSQDVDVDRLPHLRFSLLGKYINLLLMYFSFCFATLDFSLTSAAFIVVNLSFLTSVFVFFGTKIDILMEAVNVLGDEYKRRSFDEMRTNASASGQYYHLSVRDGEDLGEVMPTAQLRALLGFKTGRRLLALIVLLLALIVASVLTILLLGVQHCSAASDAVSLTPNDCRPSVSLSPDCKRGFVQVALWLLPFIGVCLAGIGICITVLAFSRDAMSRAVDDEARRSPTVTAINRRILATAAYK